MDKNKDRHVQKQIMIAFLVKSFNEKATDMSFLFLCRFLIEA